jgi:predicted transcriptional regulator
VGVNLADFRPSYKTKVNAGVYAIMVFQLVEGATVQDIVDESGLSPATVRKYINAMYNAQALRIIRWDMNTAGRRNVAVYKLEIRSTNNKNAKRPSFTPGERQARYKARLRGAKAQALGTIWKAQARNNEDLTRRPHDRSL